MRLNIPVKAKTLVLAPKSAMFTTVITVTRDRIPVTVAMSLFFVAKGAKPMIVDNTANPLIHAPSGLLVPRAMIVNGTRSDVVTPTGSPNTKYDKAAGISARSNFRYGKGRKLIRRIGIANDKYSIAATSALNIAVPAMIMLFESLRIMVCNTPFNS